MIFQQKHYCIDGELSIVFYIDFIINLFFN
jgi:hypothetical protein